MHHEVSKVAVGMAEPMQRIGFSSRRTRRARPQRGQTGNSGSGVAGSVVVGDGEVGEGVDVDSG